jgi:GTP cyclohydrolase II
VAEDGGGGGPSRWSASSTRRARADVQRAITEGLAGRPVVMTEAGAPPRLVLPVDAHDPQAWAELRAVASGPLLLAVSGTRAAALGTDGLPVATLSLPASVTEERVLRLAAGAGVADAGPLARGDRIAQAAVELGKLAKLLPAAIIATVDDAARIDGLLHVSAADVLAFRAGLADTLRRVSSAPVPLRAASDCELIVFRDELGESWSMIRVGRPDPDRPVPVRLHSACLTGDAFGSLRCDCGDQLRMALAALEALGGGALLYLAQEGCGLGLANKMRAYRLQEAGLDTVDANTALGFDMDERRYDAAARMLRSAGIDRVALLTNNPSKLAGMRAAGIDVHARIPLLAPVLGGNRRYMEAKRRRAGHLIGGASTLTAP